MRQIDDEDMHNHYGGWVPRDRNALKKWISDELTIINKNWEYDGGYRSSVIQEFQDLIESDPEIYMYFIQMFFQEKDEEDGIARVNNYKELMKVFDHYINDAPWYQKVAGTGDIIGVPIYAFLDKLMNTAAGASAFRNPKVNAQFKRMFDTWTKYLVSPLSRKVIVTDAKGWLGPAAIEALDKAAGGRFQDLYICDTSQPHWGFRSWDHFFTRRFRDGPEDPRPVRFPDRKDAINAACESTVYRISQDVKPTSSFWVKGHPYSLNFMMNNDSLASQFEGGTVFQAFLSPLNYHRWNSPVDGRIVKAYVVPGTYYAAWPDDQGTGVLIRSQAYETALAARAIVFIESSYLQIGLMCFIAVGMAEVSSCELLVNEGDAVKKGDELGTFHFGGSTHCLIFRPEAKVTFVAEADPGKSVCVKSVIAFAR